MVTSEVKTILVVAAENFELKYIRPQSSAEWILTANGPGPALAGEAADRVGPRVDAVISAGLCGALSPGLHVGDIVVASAVNGEPVECPKSVGRFTRGAVASIDRVAQTAAEKAELARSGAIAVEMEAAAVLQRARRWGLPFYCIRAVSDTSDESFELDLNAARDISGRFRVGRILTQAACRPLSGVPELLRLRRNSETACRALGEFIGNCSF
jgi:hypothetical protein